MRKVAVLISGRGSNMASLVEACADEKYPARIVVVVSNRPDAAGLDFARAHGIATVTIDHTEFEDRESFDAEIDRVLREHEAEYVCLAGFMRLLSSDFVEAWRDHLLNIHPSLLPAYPGVRIHERVIDDGVRISGCTVHYVRASMDTGPIIAQAAVPVLAGDTPEALAERVLAVEHKLYPMALRMVCDGTVRASGERVMFSAEDEPAAPLFSPRLS